MTARRALALLAALSLLLVGCSDDPEPKMPDPPATSSATPTEEPTETETPEAESAEDFIRRWVEAGDEMQVTGETAEYAAMTPTCQPCQAFVENVKSVYESGGSAEFAGSRIVQIKRMDDAPPTYNLTKDIPDTIIKRAGQKEQKLPGGRSTIRVTLKQVDGKWRITHFGIL